MSRLLLLLLAILALTPAAQAQSPCEITELTAVVGDCNLNANTYQLTVNFQVQNPTDDQFDLWGNGELIGTYQLSALPLSINNFPYLGVPGAYIKVCINDNPNCCKIKQFLAPNCFAACEIYDLTVVTGDCNVPDSAYQVTVDFEVENPSNTHFNLWGNGILIGTYPLTALPLTVNNFHYNGGPNDVLKVCINDNPNCCKIKEFPVPDCFSNTGACEIAGLTVVTGQCNVADSTYKITINFDVANPTDDQFDLWGNGELIGTYLLSALPLTINNFPYIGLPWANIKVCINDNPNCCKIKEFPVPGCFSNTGACDIKELTVMTGDCNVADSTYQVKINFVVQNPTALTFGLWANGTFVGNYPIASLPLTINNFPYNGGVNDYLKVCVAENPDCCETKEFPVPPCFSGCHIYDLEVSHTACICGQFFALVRFKYSGGSNTGFDITGNGVNYGNFPYNYNQPVILGPLMAGTAYEFVVKDHANPDCQDTYELGAVNCFTSMGGGNNAFAGSMAVSPNPANEWLSVQLQLPGRSALGNVQADIFQVDGRLIRSQQLAEGSQFSLSVGDLPPGTYQLQVITDYGTLQKSFVIGR